MDERERIERQSAEAAAAINRGRALRAKKDWLGAIAEFGRAIALAPLHPLPYFDRGSARAAHSDNLAAIADLDRAIALFPPSELRAIAYNNRGVARELVGDRDGAIRDLQLAIAGGWERARGELVRMKASMTVPDDDFTGAASLCRQAERAPAPLDQLVLFQRATECAPGMQFAWHWLGIINAVLRRNDAALAALDRALAIEPQHPMMRAEGLMNRSALRTDREGAIADLEACIALCGAGDYPPGEPDKRAAFIDGLASKLERLRSEPVTR